MRVFECVAELVRRSGTSAVFGLVGSSNVTWVGHGVEAGWFRYVRTRHEDTAVASATGYARVSGNVGVATVTVGPGFANTVNALAAAERDHVPLVLITGQGKRGLDQRGIGAALGVGMHEVGTPADLETAFWSAWDQTSWNGTPQVVCIEESILTEELTLSHDRSTEQQPKAAPEPESVAAAVDVLATATRPLILAGWGAARAGCREDLIELAELVGARLATTLNVNCFFSGHPYDLGVCGDSAPAIMVEELSRTDVVLSVGASLNSRTTGAGLIFERAKVIQCELDVERDFKASSPELGLLGDAGVAVRALIAEWRRRGLGTRAAEWDVTLPEAREWLQRVDTGQDASSALDLRRVYDVLNRVLPADRVVITDGGRAERLLPALIEAPPGVNWIPSRGYGSIGLGLGATIGAAIAAPDKPVVLFCGDGGFMMSAQELDALRLNGIRATIVILNDEQYGSEIKYLDRCNLPRSIARQSMPDTVALARAFGGDGVVVRTEEELAEIRPPDEGFLVVDVRIDPDVNWVSLL